MRKGDYIHKSLRQTKMHKYEILSAYILYYQKCTSPYWRYICVLSLFHARGGAQHDCRRVSGSRPCQAARALGGPPRRLPGRTARAATSQRRALARLRKVHGWKSENLWPSRWEQLKASALISADLPRKRCGRQKAKHGALATRSAGIPSIISTSR